MTSSVAPAASVPSGTLDLVVNARHLAGPHTGIEVYMEQLLEALSLTGQVSITACHGRRSISDLPEFAKWCRSGVRS